MSSLRSSFSLSSSSLSSSASSSCIPDVEFDVEVDDDPSLAPFVTVVPGIYELSRKKYENPMTSHLMTSHLMTTISHVELKCFSERIEDDHFLYDIT